jgi:cysteine desulfurase/selenocysteine lyase
MQTGRREFLQKMSGVAALAASPSVLGQAEAMSTPQSLRVAGKQASLNTESLRAQFPVLAGRVNGNPLVYLDSAATTQRPRAVIDGLTNFYLHENANPSPTLHTLARRCAASYQKARERVAKFVNARGPEEIVWTRGTTEAINLVAASWGGANLRSGDEMILTVSEHYSSLVPWQLAAKRSGARVRVLDVQDDGRLRLDQFDTLLSSRTKLVVFPHVSNVLGLINPAKDICARAHRVGAAVLVDGAQSVPHFSIDVQDLGCDFFAFSGHKMCGPMGTGVLWAREEILDKMAPYQSGSNMAHNVEMETAPAHFAAGSLKFEAGTPNVAGAVGLATAIEFLESLGRKALWMREQELTRYALRRLREVPGLRILGGGQAEDRVSVFSFVIENKKPLDVVTSLDTQGIAIREGDLASLPLLKRMGVSAAIRASCYVYTTNKEIDQLVAALNQTIGVL